MSLGVGRGMLLDAHKELMRKWAIVRDDWNDATADRYQKEFLDPIEPRIRMAVSGMERLAEVAAAARRECE